MPDLDIPLSSPDIDESDIQAVVDVLRTRHLSLGPKLPEFEGAICDYVGVRHAVAVNSGTSGLHCLVRALNWGEGTTVFTTPFSFIASANCILFERAHVRFVDIDPVTYNIDPDALEDAVSRTKGPRALLAVDVFGLPAEWDRLADIAERHRMTVIEDSCEALGATYRDRMAGTFGDAAVFAFYPNKQMTTGEGGVVVTDRDDLAALCRSYRNQGRGDGAEWLQHTRLGYNYRLSDINCALGISQLKRLPSFLHARSRVAARYHQALADSPLKLLSSPPHATRSWFVYVVQLPDTCTRLDRDRIIATLKSRGVACSNYFTPIHLQPFYRERGFGPGDFPVTEHTSERTIALPFHNNLSEETVHIVARELLSALP